MTSLDKTLIALALAGTAAVSAAFTAATLSTNKASEPAPYCYEDGSCRLVYPFPANATPGRVGIQNGKAIITWCKLDGLCQD